MGGGRTRINVADQEQAGSAKLDATELVLTTDRDDDGTMGESLSHVLVTDPADLPMVISAIGESGPVGLDTETTGLDPRTDRVRLLSLACDTVDGGTAAYLFVGCGQRTWSSGRGGRSTPSTPGGICSTCRMAGRGGSSVSWRLVAAASRSIPLLARPPRRRTRSAGRSRHGPAD
jgi:hypothetical protein